MTTDQTSESSDATAVELATALFEALKKRDVPAVLALDSDNAVGDVVAIGEFRGKPAIQGFLDEVFTAFPDYELVVDCVFGDHSMAAVEWHATGTFSGAMFQGIQPTGKSVAIRGVDLVEVVGGRIVRDTMFYDGASLARQIGLLPRSGSRAEKAMLAAFNGVSRLRQRHPTR